MVVVTIQPSSVTGKIFAPASKSSMQRACAAALVSKGTSIIHNPGISNDDKAALDIIKNLGATATFNEGILTIESNGVNPTNSPLGDGGYRTIPKSSTTFTPVSIFTSLLFITTPFTVSVA